MQNYEVIRLRVSDPKYVILPLMLLVFFFVFLVFN